MSSAPPKPSRPTRRDYDYWKSYPTRWSDNDQYAHVNNAMYYLLIDSIVNAFLAECCGCAPSPLSRSASQDEPHEDAPIGLVISSQCTFFAPFSFPETIDLGLRVVRLGTSSAVYEVGFFSSESSNVCGNRGEDEAKAVGGYTHVFVERNGRRPVKAMGTRLRQGLASLVVKYGLERTHQDRAKL